MGCLSGRARGLSVPLTTLSKVWPSKGLYEVPKLRQGRPPEHDWEGVTNYITSLFPNRESLPPEKARVTEAAEDWFRKNDGYPPDRRDIRRRIIKPLYDE